MTFLIENQKSGFSNRDADLKSFYHAPFKFLFLCSTVEKCVLYKYAEGNRQKSLLSWHFTIFTCFEWNFGREPLLLSLNFQIYM